MTNINDQVLSVINCAEPTSKPKEIYDGLQTCSVL